ncbi:MAG: NRDE family protein [Myxococcales bacterium FL481]|nr:MAG: NRDE family protein [Myxococcales bacterium FL481]
MSTPRSNSRSPPRTTASSSVEGRRSHSRRMCTLSAVVDQTGLLVTMNRDELDSREPELPLAIHAQRDLADRRWLAPIDAQRGGTWIGANDRGLVVALLNGYSPRDDRLVGAPSRGTLVVGALAQATMHGAVSWVGAEHDLRPYASFSLILADLSGLRAFTWDGTRLAERTPPWPRRDAAMYTSSSWAGPAVARCRREAFSTWLARGQPKTDGVPDFHLIGRGDPAEWTPLMARPRARTRSITQLRVQVDEIRGRHWLVDHGRVELTSPLREVSLPRTLACRTSAPSAP